MCFDNDCLSNSFLVLGIKYIPNNAVWMMIGGICGGFSLLPHELLHAICYKGMFICIMICRMV